MPEGKSQQPHIYICNIYIYICIYIYMYIYIYITYIHTCVCVWEWGIADHNGKVIGNIMINFLKLSMILYGNPHPCSLSILDTLQKQTGEIWLVDIPAKDWRIQLPIQGWPSAWLRYDPFSQALIAVLQLMIFCCSISASRGQRSCATGWGSRRSRRSRWRNHKVDAHDLVWCMGGNHTVDGWEILHHLGWLKP